VCCPYESAPCLYRRSCVWVLKLFLSPSSRRALSASLSKPVAGNSIP